MQDNIMFRAWGNTYLKSKELAGESGSTFMIEEDGTLTKCTYHTWDTETLSYYKGGERFESSVEYIPMIEGVMDRPIVGWREMVFHVDEGEKIPNTYGVFRSLNGDIKVFCGFPGEVVVGRYIDSIPYKTILDSNNYPPETVERIINLYRKQNEGHSY